MRERKSTTRLTGYPDEISLSSPAKAEQHAPSPHAMHLVDAILVREGVRRALQRH